MDQEAYKQAIFPIIQHGLDAWYWRGYFQGLITGIFMVWLGYGLTQFAIGFYNGWKRSRARR